MMRDSNLKIKLVTITLIVLLGILVIYNPINVAKGDENDLGEKPEWHLEDYWEYNIESMHSSVENKTFRMEVVSTNENVDVDETIYECAKVNWTLTTSEDTRKEVHFYVKKTLAEVAFIIPEKSTYAFKPPWKELDFPLEGGKTWKVQTTQFNDTGGEVWEAMRQINFKYTCEGKTTITVPAGTFEAYKINQTNLNSQASGQNIITYYSPEVNNTVLKKYYDRGIHVASERLTDYELNKATATNDDNSNEDNNNTPDLSTSIIVLVIAISALIYSFIGKDKKKKKKVGK